jgi:hypothetical protein
MPPEGERISYPRPWPDACLKGNATGKGEGSPDYIKGVSMDGKWVQIFFKFSGALYARPGQFSGPIHVGARSH